MLDIVAESDSEHGGMFSVLCRKCDTETTNEWVSDPSVYRFKATCEKCKESMEFRLNTPYWSGRP